LQQKPSAVIKGVDTASFEVDVGAAAIDPVSGNNLDACSRQRELNGVKFHIASRLRLRSLTPVLFSIAACVSLFGRETGDFLRFMVSFLSVR
jgi:hypothetical protein